MLHLKIEIDGKTPSDMDYWLQQATRYIQREYTPGIPSLSGKEGDSEGGYTFSVSGESEETWGLLVSNVGWVRSDCPDYNEVKGLYDEYVASKQYGQVTLWSSAEHDPIEEFYIKGHPDNEEQETEQAEGEEAK